MFVVKEVSEMNDTQNKRTSNLAAGIAGGIIGAAVAVGAMALTDPKNRKKADQKIKDLRQWGNKALSDINKKTAKDNIDEIDEKVKSIQEGKNEDQKSSSLH